jgi:hypothetical protein
VISTPDARSTDPNTPNPFHEKELTEDAFLRLIGQTFEHVTTTYQGYHFGSVLTQAKPENAPLYWKRTGFLDYAEDGGQAFRRYVIAAASHDEAIELPTGLLHDGLIVASLNKRIAALEAELAKVQEERTTVAQ